MTTPVKIGIIGPGLVFWRHHYPALTKLGDLFRITAILYHRRKPELPHELTEVAVTSDPEHFFSCADFDAVDIATPIGTHKEWISQGLERDKWIFVEKPVAGLRTDLEWLERLPAARQAKIFVGENFRFIPPLVELKKLVDEKGAPPLFAELHHFHDFSDRNPYAATDWRKNPVHEGGLLLDGGIHLISAGRWLLGDLKLGNRTLLSLSEKFGPHDTAVIPFGSTCGTPGLITMSFAMTDHDPTLMRIYFKDSTYLCSKTALTRVSPEGSSQKDSPAGKDFENEFRQWHSVIHQGTPTPYPLHEALADAMTALEFFS